MVNRYKPLVVFLIKTKRKNHEMDWLRSRWKFDRCITVESVERGGGLALLWMNEAKLEVRSLSKYHIDVEVGNEGEGINWHFTGFYRDPDSNK